jgi:hypothetical protein
MDLTTMTEAEFLGQGALEQSGPAIYPTPEEMSELVRGASPDLSAYVTLSTCGDYRVIKLGWGSTGLVDALGKLVGYYVGEGLVIVPPAKGRGLSVPLVLHAVAERSPPKSRKVTSDGEGALRKAWRVANGADSSPWWPPS